MDGIHFLIYAVAKACEFAFPFVVLALVIAGANELFGFGWWTDDSPVVTSEGEGTFGEFAVQTGALAVVTGLLGPVVLHFVDD